MIDDWTVWLLVPPAQLFAGGTSLNHLYHVHGIDLAFPSSIDHPKSASLPLSVEIDFPPFVPDRPAHYGATLRILEATGLTADKDIHTHSPSS